MTTRKYPLVMSPEEFRERIRAIVGPRITNPEDRPCVRKPTDKGFFPPTKK